jgi:hypothetical protein
MRRTPAPEPAMRAGAGERRDSSGGAWCRRGERGPGAEGEVMSHQQVRGGGSGAELARARETEQEIILFYFILFYLGIRHPDGRNRIIIVPTKYRFLHSYIMSAN